MIRIGYYSSVTYMIGNNLAKEKSDCEEPEGAFEAALENGKNECGSVTDEAEVSA
jgi:hypothetical protein